MRGTFNLRTLRKTQMVGFAAADCGGALLLKTMLGSSVDGAAMARRKYFCE